MPERHVSSDAGPLPVGKALASFYRRAAAFCAGRSSFLPLLVHLHYRSVLYHCERAWLQRYLSWSALPRCCMPFLHGVCSLPADSSMYPCDRSPRYCSYTQCQRECCSIDDPCASMLSYRLHSDCCGLQLRILTCEAVCALLRSPFGIV